MRGEATTGDKKIFYGWWIVLVAAVGMFLGYGAVFNFTFSVFSAPVSREFHWSRSAVSAAYALSLIAYGLSTPVTGHWADQFGARKVIVPSVIAFGLCLTSMSLLTDNLWHFFAMCLLLGLVGSGSAVVPYFGVITHWFDRRRGLALGLAMIGVGLSNFSMPSIAHRLITAVGWREAYLLIGLAVLLVPIPIALFLKERPHMMGLLPDGATFAPVKSESRSVSHRGMSGREALTDRVFWLLFIAVFLVATSVIGCLIHLVPMLTDRGMSGQAAAFATSLFGGAIIPGRVGSGYLLDRYFASKVAITFFCGAALGIFLLGSGVTGVLAFVSAFLVGMGMGAEGEIMAYLISRYFGLRAFGQIFGYAMVSFTLGGIVGPLLMGICFDQTGSYRLMLGMFLAATLVGALLMTRLGPYRTWQPASEPVTETAPG